MRRLFDLIVCMMALTLVTESGWADVATSTGDGNWNDPIWDTGVPIAGDHVVIDGDDDVVLTAATPALATVLITNTASITFSNWTTKLEATDVTIASTDSAGALRHYANTDSVGTPGVYGDWTPDARVYLDCANLTLLANTKIRADGKGYQTTTNNGLGPGGGAGYLSATYGCGSYGGIGEGLTEATYGSASAPTDPGSGGGADAPPGYQNAGHPGGGAVRIDASGAVTIDGTIEAGGYGAFAGAGSGGSVYISCDTFHGSGAINAPGGGVTHTGRRGGGGRIAVVYDTVAQAGVSPQPTVVFTARGGQSSASTYYTTYRTGEGTLYLSDGAFWPPTDGVLIGGGQIIIPGLVNVVPDSLTIDNDPFVLSSNLVGGVTNNLVIRGRDGRLEIPNDFTVGGNIVVTNYGEMHVHSGEVNGSPDYGLLVTVGGDILVGSSGKIYPHSHSTNGGSALFRAANVTVDGTSEFSAYAKGFAASYDNAYGPAALSDSGGGHGGKGSGATGTYGSSNAPVTAGSAGWKTTGTGGFGGGVVRIEALGALSTVTIDGTVNASGGGQNYSGRSGAGGSVFIKATTFAGSGTLSARGGGAASTGGSGGGGRIAVIYGTYTWTGDPANTDDNTHESVDEGNPGYTSAEDGTLFWGLIPPAPGGTTIHIK